MGEEDRWEQDGYRALGKRWTGGEDLGKNKACGED